MSKGEGGGLGWRKRYLRELAEAGGEGLPAWQFGSSAVTLPALYEAGLVKVEERVETVRYYVLTEAGKKAADALGPGKTRGR